MTVDVKFGKYYVNRKGKVRGPIVETGYPDYPFSDGERSYTAEGVWHKRRLNHNFDLVKEHTPEPTLFRDMSDAEKLKLYEAQNAGKPIEELKSNGEWEPNHIYIFHSDKAYRERPEPRVETRTWYVRFSPNGAMAFCSEECADLEITYQIIDGKTDLSSFTFTEVPL